MNLIRCLHITNANEAIQHMKRVGVDPTGVKLMEGKTLHLNLKVEGIEPRTANLLKQELLSLGGDVAVDGRGLDCSAKQTDAILMGTQKQFAKLLLKMDQYPDLHPLGESFRETIKNISKTHYTIRCRKNFDSIHNYRTAVHRRTHGFQFRFLMRHRIDSLDDGSTFWLKHDIGIKGID